MQRSKIDWQIAGGIKVWGLIGLGLLYWVYSVTHLAYDMHAHGFSGDNILARKVVWYVLVPILFPAVILQLMPGTRTLAISVAGFLAFCGWESPWPDTWDEYIRNISGTSEGILISVVCGLSIRAGVFLSAKSHAKKAPGPGGNLWAKRGLATLLFLVPYFLFWSGIEILLSVALHSRVTPSDDVAVAAGVFFFVFAVVMNAIPLFLVNNSQRHAWRKSLASAALKSLGGTVISTFFMAFFITPFYDQNGGAILLELAASVGQLAAFAGALVLGVGAHKKDKKEKSHKAIAAVLLLCFAFTSLPVIVPLDRTCSVKGYVPSTCLDYAPGSRPARPECSPPADDTKYLCWSPGYSRKWHWTFNRDDWFEENPPPIDTFS